MPPINPLLLKSGAQALGRVVQQVGKAAPGLAGKAADASRLASKAMSGVSGLSSRMPSKLPSAATLQQGLSGLRPRLQNASLLGQMGRLGQVAQLSQMLPTGSTQSAAPGRPTGSTTAPVNPGHIPLGQFGEIRDKAHAALKGPMAAALRGSDRAAHVASEFLQALHDIESSALYQNFAPALVNQMLGEAKTGLQAIHDLIQRFQSGLGKLDTALQPAPSGATPRPPRPPLPPRPSRPGSTAATEGGKPSSATSTATSTASSTASTTASSAASTATSTAAFTTAPMSPSTSTSASSSAQTADDFSAASTLSTAPTTPSTGPAK